MDSLLERLIPLGFQQIADVSAAVGLTVPAEATLCVFCTETQSVRWRDDGTSPTAAIGMLQTAAQPPYLYHGDPAKLKFIEATATAKLNVSYYKHR